MRKVRRILLDLDDTYVDFVGGAARLFGLKGREDLYPHWEPGVWDCVPPLARALGEPGFGTKEFWARITELKGAFWNTLRPHDWAGPLLQMIISYSSEWYFVSSPSRCPTSYYGKARWLKRYFGPDFNRFELSSHKHLFARPDTLLIDDRETTVELFRKEGGLGIVFPAHQNSLHALKERPLDHVQADLVHATDPDVYWGDWEEVYRKLYPGSQDAV